MILAQELADARALVATHADTVFDAGLRIADLSHRRDLTDALVGFDPEILLAVMKASRLGVPEHARRAVVATLTDMLTADPILLIGAPLPRDLVTLEILERFYGSCTSDQHAYLVAEAGRNTRETNRRRFQDLLRQRAARGEELPDCGENPAEPSITWPNGKPHIAITQTPRRIDHAPVPGPVRSRHGFRAVHR